ncbi:MAG: hypothetical protein U0869_17535 [Chloroflexota bacterium]
MTDEPIAKVFDMPHARVTLTPVGPNVEIEVWPKQGQSAYAVVDPAVAILIARHLVTIAAAQIAAAQAAAAEEAGDEDEDAEPEDGGAGEAGEDEAVPATLPVAITAAGEPAPDAAVEPDAGGDGEDDDLPPPPSNIVDLASRRRTGKPSPA